MEHYYLDTTIDELYQEGHISLRVYHDLENNGIYSIGDVNSKIIKSNRNLPIVKGVGRNTSNFLLELSHKVEQNCPISPDKRSWTMLSNKEREISEKSYKQIINDTNYGPVVQRFYKSSYMIFIQSLAYSSSLVEYIDNMACNEYQLLRTAYLHYSKLMVNYLLKEGLDNRLIYKVFSRNHALLYSTPIIIPYEKMVNKISVNLSSYLQRKYDEICINMLSTRALNFKKQYLPNFKDTILFWDKDEVVSQIIPDTTMISTNNEIVNMLSEFKDFYLKHINDDDESLIEMNIMDEYPFLSHDERVFILDFKNEFGYKPLLYILYKYLTTSNESFEKIFCRRYGLNGGNEELSREIAMDYNLSETRIRQILSDYSKVNELPIIYDKDWDKYDIPYTYIMESSQFFIDITTREKINLSITSLGALLSLKYKVKTITVNGNYIILINDILQNINLSNYFNYINSLINSVHFEDKCISLKNIIIEKCGVFDNSIIALTKKIFANYISISFENDSILIKKNKIDIVSELEVILQQANEPLKLDVLFSRLKEKFPEIIYDNSFQIKPYIQKSSNIEPIGKQGIYGLREWKNINYNGIRGTIENILIESDEPIHIDVLLDKVKEYFPTTNFRSILTSLENEETGRFVRFENNYFGLSCKSYASSFVLYDKIRIYSFNERISQLESFCELNKRFPILFYSNDTETSLSRWLSRVQAGLIKISNKQKIMFEDMVHKYEEMNYPKSKTEISFRENCNRYLNYVKKNKKLPPSRHKLHLWMYRTKNVIHTFNDTRKVDFDNLLKIISDMGL